MKIAAIDIGTNTVLLLVANVNEAGAITPVVYEQRVPRLGKGVDAARSLQRDAMMRVIDVLQEYKSILLNYDIDTTVVCGTSAVRDAKNKKEFAELVKSKVGFDLEVLSGEDEAYWTYRGAISGIAGIRKATVIDIGGGSTEITVGDDRAILDSVSLDIGSVRLTEKFFMQDPPTHQELEQAKANVKTAMAKASGFDFKGSTLVGVAGTATALAILAQGGKKFSLQAITNYKMNVEAVTLLYKKLSAMPSEQILELSSVMDGRSDIITAGTMILHEIMEHFKFKEMIVSERGVRYGLVMREWKK